MSIFAIFLFHKSQEDFTLWGLSFSNMKLKHHLYIYKILLQQWQGRMHMLRSDHREFVNSKSLGSDGWWYVGKHNNSSLRVLTTMSILNPEIQAWLSQLRTSGIWTFCEVFWGSRAIAIFFYIELIILPLETPIRTTRCF